MSHEFADADEVVIEIAGPQEGKFLDPAIIFAEVGESSFELGEGFEPKRNAVEVELDGVLVAEDVVIVHAEPFAEEGREAHEAKRESEGAVEAVFDEIPGEGRDGGGSWVAAWGGIGPVRHV